MARRRRSDYYESYYPRYSQPSREELQANARKSAAKQKANGRALEPVHVRTKRGCVAESWWGEAWCENLERYADYSNRIGRGRSYVRAGAVIDLKISRGEVRALVQGSRPKPYSVTIHIDPLSEEAKKKILDKCAYRIQDLDSLLEGKFPKELKELFTEKGGLFPNPKEIHFDCSCPDWASMCKHVAASLYGVGARFDDDPMLFFELRGIDTEDMVGKVIENSVESMLQNADRPSSRILEGEDVTELFQL